MKYSLMARISYPHDTEQVVWVIEVDTIRRSEADRYSLLLLTSLLK